MGYDLRIQTAIPLTPGEQADIITRLHKAHKFTTHIFEVDPALLGGVRLVFGEKIIDSTLKNNLNRAHSYLVEEQR